MRKPIVSIIIPVYGVEKYISSCLSSIALQDYNNIEVLIINDCTPDNSITIAQKFIKGYSGPIKFKIINHRHNLKLAAARNTGIRFANGKYIFFLDGDDELLPNSISSLVKEAVSYNSVVTTGNRKAIDWNTGRVYQTLEGDYMNLRAEHMDDVRNVQIHGTAWNKLVDRNFIIQHNLFFEEGIIYEDDLWMFKLYCTRPRFSSISNITYIYNVRPSSIMQSFSELHLYSRITIAIKAFNHIKSVGEDMQDYACYTAEKFRQGALAACLNNVSKIEAYNVLYKLLRQYKIDRKRLLTSRYASIFAKMRFLGNEMPTALGRWWNYLFIRLIYMKSRPNYPYIEKSKIDLTHSFWKRLKDYGYVE